jgi:hypothetical protein
MVDVPPSRGYRHRPLLLVALASTLLALSACESLVEPFLPDDTPPTVTSLGVQDGDTVASSSVAIPVRASDDRAVDVVTWGTGTGEAGVCLESGDDRWSCGPVPLRYGETTITLAATDAAGNRASIRLRVTRPAPAPGESEFDIDLRFYDDTFTPSQRAAFDIAAARWEQIVVGDLEDVPLDRGPGQSCGLDEPGIDTLVDDLLIFVTSDPDGQEGGVLGIAGPCLSRLSGPDVGTNAVGFMEFDATDLEILEADGDLVETIVHEMGHVLGFGTNWEFPPYFDLLDFEPLGDAPDCATADGFVLAPEYTGSAGVDAYADLGGSGWVPVEESGGLGTQCGHWDEEVFGRELMTGFLAQGRDNPLSELTIASLEDLGLTVDRDQADPYALPFGPAAADVEVLDLAGREILLRPRGGIDPASGEVTWFEAP